MRRCEIHNHARPCPQCAHRGYGGAGRGQGRKSPHQKPVRVLVTLEHAEFELALDRHPGSRSAAVRAVFLEGLAALGAESHLSRTSVAGTPRSATVPAPTVRGSASASSASQRAIKRFQTTFHAAFAQLVTLREQLHSKAHEEAKATIAIARKRVSAVASQLRRQAKRSILWKDWQPLPGSPVHSNLVEGLPALEPAPAKVPWVETWCMAALQALRAAADQIESRSYDHVIEYLLPQVRSRLTWILKDLKQQVPRPDLETARALLPKIAQDGLVQPGHYQGFYLDAPILEELVASGDLVAEPRVEGEGVYYIFPEYDTSIRN